MNFYKELLPYLEYLISIRKLENYLSFDLSFPDKWSMPKSVGEQIQVLTFQVETANSRGVSVVCMAEEIDINATLNLISKVIKLNKEREIKEQLFKKTIQELKKTFEQNDLDKLQNLYFDFAAEEETSNLDEYDGEQPEDIELASE